MIHTILCISTGSSDVHVHLILRNVCSVSALIFDFENCCKNRVRWTHIISHHPLSCINVIDIDWNTKQKDESTTRRQQALQDCALSWIVNSSPGVDLLQNHFWFSWKQFWPAGESACVNIVVSLTGSIGYIWLAGRIYANPRHLPLYYPPYLPCALINILELNLPDIYHCYNGHLRPRYWRSH